MLLVTGMHRSGTSITTQLLLEAGAKLGNPDKLFPGDKWNPDGYFEQMEILDVNISLVNGPWGKFSYFSPPSENLILKRAEKLENKIKELSRNHIDLIVKDPRFCLTLSAWKQYYDGIKKVLINVREPIQVAYSLKKRNHISIRLGLKLWYEHNKRILEYVNDIPHIFFNFNNLFSPELSTLEIKKVFKFFDLNVKDSKIDSILNKCVKSSLKHNTITEYKYEKNIRELWDHLKNKCGSY